ncbi:MAG: type III pantothenate kinase [Candidatus Omnitrophica bacterium]|nr:type III pantothenate kinase [Candidatus Omnitrophota bacterium]MCB9747720.1 type III pantothenate kinase [Candidatus Omnitrophota bacterium]
MTKMDATILSIDVGNTSVAFGVIRGQRVQAVQMVLTTLKSEIFSQQTDRMIKKVFKKYPKIEAVVICSVVPQVLKRVLRTLKRNSQRPVYVLGKDLIVPIQNNYKVPAQVGQDRLVCAYAVKMLYGYPAVVIDFGTAITFDFISARGFYEGGIIVPGIQMSTESLFKKTALLPNIESFHGPASLIGKTTEDSILSGIFHGYGAMSDEVIRRISKQTNQKTKVILTGGYTKLIRKFIYTKNVIIEKDLVFKGIAAVYATLKI